MGNNSYTVVVHSDETIKAMVSNCLQDLGGIEKLVPPCSKILLKPNMVVAKPNSTGATTNPLILDTLIEHLMCTSPREIIIGESSEVGRDTMQAYKVTGVYTVAQKWNITLLDFKKDRQIYVDVPHGKVLKEVLPGQVTGKEPYFHLPGLEVIEKGTCSSCKGALVAAIRRLHKERQSPHCTILMGQRLRERKNEFVSNFKYGTVNSAKPLISIGQCCSWVVDNYQCEQIKGCPVKAEAIYRYLRTIS